MKLTSNFRSAQRWYDAAQNASNEFLLSWRKARGHVFDAGFYLMKARAEVGHGDWLAFLEAQEQRMRPRTVFLYIALAEAALSWAKAQDPTLSVDKLPTAAREVMMLSPRPLVALLRDLREMRRFGDYDAVRYAQRKLRAPAQLELEFSRVVSTFDLLDHIGDPNFTLILPEDKNEDQAWQELETRLERALDLVRARKPIPV